MIYYQPAKYSEDLEYVDPTDIPEELASFMVFSSPEDCRKWLENNSYDPNDYTILRYSGGDIEEPKFIGQNGGGLSHYTVDVNFTHSIILDVMAEDADDAMDKAESEASMLFEEHLNDGLVGIADFTCEAQTP